MLVVRKGVEQTVKVTLGRLEDGEKVADAEEEHEKDQPGEIATEPAGIFIRGDCRRGNASSPGTSPR